MLVCVWCSVVLFFFFFFQAEDGIRDKLVTGVQTCALPILEAGGAAALTRAHGLRRGPLLPRQHDKRGPSRCARLPGRDARRSEERRVGKECRSRWWS